MGETWFSLVDFESSATVCSLRILCRSDVVSSLTYFGKMSKFSRDQQVKPTKDVSVLKTSLLQIAPGPKFGSFFERFFWHSLCLAYWIFMMEGSNGRLQCIKPVRSLKVTPWFSSRALKFHVLSSTSLTKGSRALEIILNQHIICPAETCLGSLGFRKPVFYGDFT